MMRTTVTLPDELGRLLRHEAKRRDTSVSEVARQALIAHFGLGSNIPRRISFAGLGDSGHTDLAGRMEEILAEEWADVIERDRRT